ncbi:MAG: hypothetical protein HC809_00375 [Gammaproteobacteria bacterium]|nr:hypothetical protein [Gammaproteobacteria bacterium]
MKILRMSRIAAMICLLLHTTAHADDEANAGAFAAMDAFMTAFNARDLPAWAASLQFPHVRFAGGRVDYYPDRASFIDAMSKLDLTDVEGWHHSTWDARDVIHSTPDKVHVATVFSRYRADGERYVTHNSLYILERVDGRWGVRARSSFAP